jgi:hypothetical protein
MAADGEAEQVDFRLQALTARRFVERIAKCQAAE